MADARHAPLVETAALRLRTMPARMGGVLAVAGVLHLAYGWKWLGAWVLGYVGLTLLEHFAARRLKRTGGVSEVAAAVYVATIASTSVAFGALAVPLTALGGDGEVFGFTLLSGGLLNALIVSRASRAIFVATTAVYVAFLVTIPGLELLAGVAEPVEWITGVGAVLLAVQAWSAWRVMAASVRAEGAARTELDLRRREAERATDAKSAFVAVVSHELRTPLSGLLAAGEELQRRLERQDNREAAAVLVDAGRFMKTLLDDLLDLAKLEAGKMSVEAVDFDIGQLVWTLERHWSASARAAGKPLRLASVTGLPTMVSGDPTRLRQVLNNLLSNAVKFTGPEGVTWTVDVCVGPNCDVLGASGLVVRVTDTGPGMTAEQLSRLFTAFDQTTETVARTHGGTGLGLALSRELARRMGGDLSVESAPGRGSTFTLHLPLAPATGVAVEVEPESAPGCAADLRPALRILVVDDHPLNRRTLGLLLEPIGAEVIAAESSAEALDQLAAEGFDLVLTDLHMPDMNGLALARAIRAGSGPNREVPMIVVTGADSDGERAACVAAGIGGHVLKPIDVGALYAALDAALSDTATKPLAEAEAA